MSDIKLEICCASVDDVVNAELGGSDRVELTTAMDLGGLTPTIGEFLQIKKLTKIPVMSMIRPRSGGFCYCDNEFEQMCLDAQALIKAGSEGVVFGILNDDGTLDFQRCKKFVDVCRSTASPVNEAVEIVFHRAIDATPNWKEAIDQLIKIGVDRVLTSGQKPTALEGYKTIRDMVSYTDKIEILAGSGIRENNALEVIEKTGVRQIHMTANELIKDNSCSHAIDSNIFFNANTPISENAFKRTDKNLVKKIKIKLKNC